MSPIHSIPTMSDDEVKKNYDLALKHIKDVHNSELGHDEFETFLASHPYYRDIVDEYRKRWPEPPSTPVPEEILNEAAEGKIPEETSETENPPTQVSEGAGQEASATGDQEVKDQEVKGVSDHEQGGGEQ